MIMKKLLIIAIALVTIQVTAQDQKKEMRKAKMEKANDMTPEEMVQLQTKRMTLQLDLTEAQQAQVEKILIEDAKARKEKIENFKAKKESSDSDKPTKEERIKMMNERLDHQIAMKKKMKAILNDEQYKKWETTQENRFQRKQKTKAFKKAEKQEKL
jgi:hypothetical protein